jgi:hypothetical protein
MAPRYRPSRVTVGEVHAHRHGRLLVGSRGLHGFAVGLESVGVDVIRTAGRRLRSRHREPALSSGERRAVSVDAPKHDPPVRRIISPRSLTFGSMRHSARLHAPPICFTTHRWCSSLDDGLHTRLVQTYETRAEKFALHFAHRGGCRSSGKHRATGEVPWFEATPRRRSDQKR